jgi:hypothetical protein
MYKIHPPQCRNGNNFRKRNYNKDSHDLLFNNIPSSCQLHIETQSLITLYYIFDTVHLFTNIMEVEMNRERYR